MKQQLRANLLFYVSAFIFILIGLFIVLYFPKSQAVLALNGINNPNLDKYFSFATLLGEVTGGIILGVILILLKEIKYLVIYFIAILFCSSISSLLKYTVFDDVKRPSALFMDQVRQVEGEKLHKMHSFPSGHTTAAFCFGTILALTFKTKSAQFIGIFWAISVGVSRVYLGQHFPLDVVAGATLGIIVTTIVFRKGMQLFTAEWWNKRLIKT